MAKVIDCGKVNPASGCGHVIRGETEEEALRLAAQHAERAHGMQPTPALMAMVKSYLQDA